MNPLLTIAIDAALHAGDEIMNLYETVTFDTKIDGSPVTIADTRAHNIIVEYLSETSIPILSEESDGITLPYPERLWIIDPLDGTKDFIAKTGDFAVMIGLIENGIPILGVVYAPAQQVLYYAELGKGAYMRKEDITIKLSMEPTPATPLRYVCSVHNFHPYMEAITHKLQAVRVPHGSIGIKAAILARNKADFFCSWGTFGEWDICAPHIIAAEAGLIVTDAHGNPLNYGTKENRVEHGVLFSHPDCFTQVREAIASTPHP